MPRTFSGRRLREARVAADLSSERLALSTERSVYSIHEYERGRVRPPLDVAARLASVLGCTVDDLLEDDALTAHGGAA